MEDLKELKKKLDNAELEYKSLLSEFNSRTNFVLMYLNKSGKHTFVLQPKNQIENLISNGWQVVTKENLNDFLEYYGLEQITHRNT